MFEISAIFKPFQCKVTIFPPQWRVPETKQAKNPPIHWVFCPKILEFFRAWVILPAKLTIICRLEKSCRKPTESADFALIISPCSVPCPDTNSRKCKETPCRKSIKSPFVGCPPIGPGHFFWYFPPIFSGIFATSTSTECSSLSSACQLKSGEAITFDLPCFGYLEPYSNPIFISNSSPFFHLTQNFFT